MNGPWEVLKSWLTTHFKITLYLSWMIVPVLISFPYFGGPVQKLSGGFQQPSLASLFVNGDLFDFKRRYYCMTGLVCIGMLVALIRSYSFTKSDLINKMLNTDAIFTFWIIPISIVSVVVYTDTVVPTIVGYLIPSGMTIPKNKSLFIGVQFCAIMLIGLALEKIVQLLSCVFTSNHNNRKYLTTAVVFFLSVILIAHGADRLAEETSNLMELKQEFEKAISQVSNQASGMRGRILTNSKLGTLSTERINYYGLIKHCFA